MSFKDDPLARDKKVNSSLAILSDILGPTILTTIMLFQSSAVSNAFTVKSLPGASYLYIPVMDSAASSNKLMGGGGSGGRRDTSQVKIHGNSCHVMNSAHEMFQNIIKHHYLSTEVRLCGEEVSVGPRDPLLEALRAPHHPHRQPLLRKLW